MGLSSGHLLRHNTDILQLNTYIRYTPAKYCFAGVYRKLLVDDSQLVLDMDKIDARVREDLASPPVAVLGLRPPLVGIRVLC